MSAEPRVTIQLVEKRDEALALAEELGNFPHAIASMRIVAESAEGRFAMGCVVRLASGEIVGWGHARMRGSMAELSWETHQDHRGHGYMREAAPHFVEALLRRPDVTHAYASIPESNTPSAEVARACGMDPTGATGAGRMWSRAANPPSA
jgi:RimJ/RimL family protein N-acetyltransferase